jgi:acyl-CoA synthetase (AMP-forming)/AMP-acid ligase II
MGAPWCARPLRRRSSRGPKPAVVADSHPAIITATSGSTGLPKLAVRSHGFLDRQQQVLRRHLDIAPGSCDLATLLVFALVDLAAGATCVVADADLRRVGQVAARPVLSQIHRHRVRSIVASPAFFERICPENTVDHLAWIATGGAPLVPDALQRFADWAPEARVEGVYGSTEAEPIATMDAAAISAEDRQASVSGAGLLAGHPVPDIHCTLRDLSAGSAGWHPATADFGEILVAGSHVLTGYLDGAGDRERKIHHGGRIWHRTGDCGRFDAQGRLWLLGRCDAVLRHRDQYRFPFAVEVAARGRSGGARCALVDAGTGPCLVVEGPAEPLRPWAASLGIDQVCTHPIPLDRRHNAKVDYPALIRSLQEQPHGH